ncbi:MAG TPA: undecaprenyl-diphosphate phosphatase [Firmicutes bacterium]|nr:undecaprenyl-diphosphate phosphatase [Bacillota bacterium]
MSLFHAIILGFVQGVTEFLPVSSSGHLVLLQQLLQIEAANLAFDVAVHVGTLVAVVVALWDDVVVLFDGLQLRRTQRTLAGRRLIRVILVGSIPAALVGLLLQDFIRGLFSSAYVTGIMLLVTGLLLYFAEKMRKGDITIRRVSYVDALFVGLGQALAILPGLSRSGTTISAGLARGIARSDAARFSFLLSIPAIVGAAILELPALFNSSGGIAIAPLLAGMVTAAIAGYFAIVLLVRFVQRGNLRIFSYYTWVVGVLALLFTYLNG